MKKLAGTIVCVAILGGCAQTPPVTVSYYASKAGLSARLVRTLGCDKDNLPVVATTPTVTVTQAADESRPLKMDLSAIDGPMANSDLKLEFYTDRRLKAVNATTTGQGEAILKSAISLAGAVGLERGDDAELVAQCKEFKKHFAEATLTLIFSVEENFETLPHKVAFVPDAQSTRFAAMFPDLLGDACLQVGAPKVDKPVEYPAGLSGYVKMPARQPARVAATVSIGPPGTCEVSQIWNGYALVGQMGIDYDIPIPKAALFGKQVFNASFDESGGLTLLQYGKDTGEGSALNVAKAAFDEFTTTDAEKAAALKSEADVIAAQQRLVKCQTTPTSC